jgi:hypothetical protein
LTVFHTAPRAAAEGGPAPAIPREALFTQSAPASVSQAVLAVPATPSPVALPSAADAANSSAADALAATLQQPAMLPPCAPANLFTSIYSSRGDVRTALGCVVGTTRTITLLGQDFQRGILLAVFPDAMLYELTTDGLWRATPLDDGSNAAPAPGANPDIGPSFRRYWQSHPVVASSLGLPLSPEDANQGIEQPFTHGFMLSTAGWTYIADDAGQWQRLVSLLPGDEGSPSTPGGGVTGGVPSFPPLRQASVHTDSAGNVPGH